MERIKTPTAWIDKFGPGRNGFRDGDDTTGVLSTQLEADWFDNPQEEIANAIELSGIALNPADMTQLFQAINARVAAGVPLPPDLSVFVLKSGDVMTGGLVTPSLIASTVTANGGRLLSSAPGLNASVVVFDQAQNVAGAMYLGVGNDPISGLVPNALIFGPADGTGVPLDQYGYFNGTTLAIHGDIRAGGALYVATSNVPDFYLARSGTDNSRAIHFLVPDAGNPTNTINMNWHPSGMLTYSYTGSVYFQSQFPTGDFVILGTLQQGSDERGKANIMAAPQGMDEISQIVPILFNRLGMDGNPIPRQQLGFSAQQLQTALPLAVVEFDDDRIAVEDMAVLAALINAVKQINNRLTALEGGGVPLPA